MIWKGYQLGQKGLSVKDGGLMKLERYKPGESAVTGKAMGKADYWERSGGF